MDSTVACTIKELDSSDKKPSSCRRLAAFASFVNQRELHMPHTQALRQFSNHQIHRPECWGRDPEEGW
ncbi:unnamed protein product, partial [Clonostachys byssicola]